MLKSIFTYFKIPAWTFYLPILPYYLWLSIKRRSFSFFTNVNEGHFLGGFVGTPKNKYLEKLDKNLIPKTIYIKHELSWEDLSFEIEKKQISFPLILKPNAGEQGTGVTKMLNYRELEEAFEKRKTDLIIQEFIQLPLEFGVLYYKIPLTEEEGISSIALKELPFIIGDGVQTIRRLVMLKYDNTNFENISEYNINMILEKDEKFDLEYIAHRNRNSIFKNQNVLYDDQLLKTFSHIAKNIDGFNFGRFDVMAASANDLINGTNIKILEVNGVNSQPIHIFDPSYNWYRTYRDLHKHWSLINRISRNNSILGFPPNSLSLLLQEIKKNNKKKVEI